MKRATNSDHLVLRDQALGFRPALLRIALMICKYQLDLGAAETREPGILRRRQIQVVRIVDDVCGSFERVTRVRSDLRRGACQRPDAADQNFLAGLRKSARPESSGKRHGDTGQQHFTTIHR